MHILHWRTITLTYSNRQPDSSLLDQHRRSSNAVPKHLPLPVVTASDNPFICNPSTIQSLNAGPLRGTTNASQNRPRLEIRDRFSIAVLHQPHAQSAPPQHYHGTRCNHRIHELLAFESAPSCLNQGTSSPYKRRTPISYGSSLSSLWNFDRTPLLMSGKMCLRSKQTFPTEPLKFSWSSNF